MVRTKLTQRKLMENQRRLMDIYDRVNKKPKTLLSVKKISAICDRVNKPDVKFLKREQFILSR